MNVDLEKVFLKTVLILQRNNLWSKDSGNMPVDYAKGHSYVCHSRPADYSLKFAVDFGSSEGVYIDFALKLWHTNDDEPQIFDFGTIKTLADGRETLAAYAALGANFAYYARKELYQAFKNSFPIGKLRYEVYSLDFGNNVFVENTMDTDQIVTNMAQYAEYYQKVTEGELTQTIETSFSVVCNYLLSKSRMEQAFPMSETDIVVLQPYETTAQKSCVESFIYTGDLNNPFVSANLHAYITNKEETKHERA